jgi:hypothetical protein
MAWKASTGANRIQYGGFNPLSLHLLGTCDRTPASQDGNVNPKIFQMHRTSSCSPDLQPVQPYGAVSCIPRVRPRARSRLAYASNVVREIMAPRKLKRTIPWCEIHNSATRGGDACLRDEYRQICAINQLGSVRRSVSGRHAFEHASIPFGMSWRFCMRHSIRSRRNSWRRA